jgi:hypothetical protein
MMFRTTLPRAVDESCLMVSPKSGRAAAKPGCPIG